MMRPYVIFFAFLSAFSLSVGHAEIYTWTDEKGTVHFTEDLGTVPPTLRNKARRVEEVDSTPAEEPAAPAPSANGQTAPQPATPSSGKDEAGLAESYAGKTYQQWETELKEREAALISLRKRIDETAAMLQSVIAKGEDYKKHLAEHDSLVAQFKELKAQYYQQVEIARKAGLQVDIPQ